MWFIWRWIKEGYITAATARAIELGILWTLSAFIVGVIDNIEYIVSGGSVDWTVFLSTFGTSTALTILAWMKKRARDLADNDSGLV
jgi:hypothetical protein